MKYKLLLIGGGGHCASCIDIIENQGAYEIIGIIDKKEKLGTSLLGYQVIGTDEDIPRFNEESIFFLITLGKIGANDGRKRLYNEIHTSDKIQFATIVSTDAYVSKFSTIGEGTVVFHKAVVNAKTYVGKNCIINTGAVIEHDIFIGDHSHVSTGAIINGSCILGSHVFIGSNATIKNNISLCNDIVIGMGSVVVHDIVEPGVYFGNPAKRYTGGGK